MAVPEEQGYLERDAPAFTFEDAESTGGQVVTGEGVIREASSLSGNVQSMRVAGVH